MNKPIQNPSQAERDQQLKKIDFHANTFLGMKIYLQL